MKLRRFRILILWTIIVLNLSFGLTVHAGDDCVNCPNATKVEDPISHNSGITTLAKTQAGLANSGQQKEDDDGFSNYLNIYCMTYERLEGAFEFKEKLTDPMKVVSSDTTKYDPDKFWYYPGCNPQHIGGTSSPIIHLTAESATYRLDYLKALYKHHQKEGKVPWEKIVNAEDTRGHTVLDYLHYLNINKKFIKLEEKGVNDLYQFLCAHEGKFKVYKDNRKCSKTEYITIQTNS